MSTRVKPYRDREQIEPVIEELMHRLFGYEVHVCGSWRRGRQQIGDLDVLIVTKEGNLPSNLQIILGNFASVFSGGDRSAHATVDMHDGRQELQVDFYASAPKRRGSFLWFLTGPMGLNIAMRTEAKRQGLTLSQYGLRRPDGSLFASESEDALAAALGPKWIAYLEPAEREQWAEPVGEEPVETIEIEGSKGAKYTLTIQGRRIKCTCKGFYFGGRCRHVQEELARRKAQFWSQRG